MKDMAEKAEQKLPAANTGASRSAAAIDFLTVIAITAFACILANVLHEAAGHGGACLLSGGHALRLTSVDFECTIDSRFVDAGGTLANLIAGSVFWLLLRAAPGHAPRLRYFLWLSMAVNLMVGTGYFLFSGVANIGDWAEFIKGLGAPWAWHVGLTVLGGVSYFFVVRLSARELWPFIGGQADLSARMRRARRLMLTPYFAGSAIYCLAGAFNPGGVYLEVISAAASSLGGMSGFLWMRSFLYRPPARLNAALAPEGLPRSWAWIAGGAVLVIAFVAILGPGIRFASAPPR
jgi:hypothetical protein